MTQCCGLAAQRSRCPVSNGMHRAPAPRSTITKLKMPLRTGGCRRYLLHQARGFTANSQRYTVSEHPQTCPTLQCSRFKRAYFSRAHKSCPRSRRTCLVINAQAAASTPSEGWKGEAAWWTLLATVFIYISGLAMLAPVMPSIIVKLNLGSVIEPANAMGLLVSIYAACMCVGSLVVGRASDYFGPKRVMVVTLLGGGAALFLSSFSQTYCQFVIGRAMTGLFAGTVTCAQAYVGAISKTPEERSSRMATMQAATSIGYVCGPGVGGALLLIGTMAPLAAAGILSLVACAAALFTLPHVPPVRVQVPATDPMHAVDGVPGVPVPPVSKPAAGRKEMVAAARRDPALQLLLAACFLGAFVSPVFTYFCLTCITALQWSPAREVALFFALAGGLAVVTAASLKPLIQRMGLMNVGVAAMLARGFGVLLMGASVMFVGTSKALFGTVAGAAIVLTAALFTTIFNTLLMSFQNVAAMELVESRGASLIRGEVLSWLMFMHFLANVSAPLVLGWATSLQPADARYMFLTGVLVSMVAAGCLQRIIYLGLMPSGISSGTQISEESKNGSSGDFKAIQWGSSQDDIGNGDGKEVAQSVPTSMV